MPLLLGFLAGYVSSMPIGPINLAVLDRAVSRNIRPALLVGLGACIVDIGYVAVGFLGAIHLPSWWVTLLFGALGAAMLLWMGVTCLRRPSGTPAPGAGGGITGSMAAVGLGAVLAAGNPAFPVFWISLLGWIRSHQLMSFEPPSRYVFMAGVAAGNMSWFLTAIRLGVALGTKSTGGALKNIRYALGIVMLVAGGIWVWDLSRILLSGMSRI